VGQAKECQQSRRDLERFHTRGISHLAHPPASLHPRGAALSSGGPAAAGAQRGVRQVRLLTHRACPRCALPGVRQRRDTEDHFLIGSGHGRLGWARVVVVRTHGGRGWASRWRCRRGAGLRGSGLPTVRAGGAALGPTLSKKRLCFRPLPIDCAGGKAGGQRQIKETRMRAKSRGLDAPHHRHDRDGDVRGFTLAGHNLRLR